MHSNDVYKMAALPSQTRAIQRISFKSIAKIADIEHVRKCLFVTQGLPDEGGGGDDAWNWSVEEEAKAESRESWLEGCLVAMSPTGQVLALAHDKNLVILVGKWEGQGEGDVRTKYVHCWDGDVTRELNEHITAVLCLPVAPQARLSSSHSVSDWVCVAVGFDSGAVRFYTEAGHLLTSQVFHEGGVVSLRCQTAISRGGLTGLGDPEEALYVQYKSTLCSVHGLALANTLRVIRNQIAKMEGLGGGGRVAQVDVASLAVAKWGLSEQVRVSQVCVLGTAPPLALDHLGTASLRGGYAAAYRQTPPNTTSLLAVGYKPYIAFHGLVEGASAPVLTDVAKAVASKLMSYMDSAVSGWLGGGRSQNSEKGGARTAAAEPGETMTCRFGLCDVEREGRTIACCPWRRLSAVVDNLGRVLLLDNQTGLGLRLWKGYRDAQVAFVPAGQDKGAPGRKAMFLAIYAPKKKVIELWALEQGPRVATFPLHSAGLLVYLSHGILGAGSATPATLPPLFIDNAGLLHQITVPFLTILSVGSSSKVKDVHILRQLRRVVGSKSAHTSSPATGEEIVDLVGQITEPEMWLEGLDMVVGWRGVEPATLERVVRAGLGSRLSDLSDLSEEEQDSHPALAKCRRAVEHLARLLTLYSLVTLHRDQPPDYKHVVPDTPSLDNAELAAVLRVSPKELERLVMLLVGSGEAAKGRVQFSPPENLLPILLSSVLATYHDPPPLAFRPGLPTQTLASLGLLLCQGVLYGSLELEPWRRALEASRLDTRSLLRAVLSYWLTKPHGGHLHSELHLLRDMLASICSIPDPRSCGLEAWWTEARATISLSPNPHSALSAALVIRAVALLFEEQFSEKGDEEWERISEEACIWTQFMSQLEAISWLHSALSCKPKPSADSKMPRLDWSKCELSYSEVVRKGAGCVPELVARWVGCWGIPPAWLRPSEPPAAPPAAPSPGAVVEGLAPAVNSASEAIPSSSSEQLVLDNLAQLRKLLPYCLSPDSLVANLAWEYLLQWTKAPDHMQLLGASLTCIASVQHPRLQHGLCSMVWNVHLRLKFDATLRLLHKIGKVPKERLCRQDINISDSNVTSLLEHSISLLILMIESGASYEGCEQMEVKKESIWSEGEGEGGSQLSLVEVALGQPLSSRYLLLVKLMTARTLFLLSSFSLRFHRPLTTLLHHQEEQCLWKELTWQGAEAAERAPPDSKLLEARLSFLTKVITAALEPLSKQTCEPTVRSCSNWMSQVFSLACDWQVPLEPLRVHQICQLYSHQCDSLAQEVIPAVNERAELAHKLLVIAGQRVKAMMVANRTHVKEHMSRLRPGLSQWVLEQQECGGGGRAEPSLPDTAQLAALAASMLPEHHPQHGFAADLADALATLTTGQ